MRCKTWLQRFNYCHVLWARRNVTAHEKTLPWIAAAQKLFCLTSWREPAVLEECSPGVTGGVARWHSAGHGDPGVADPFPAHIPFSSRQLCSYVHKAQINVGSVPAGDLVPAEVKLQAEPSQLPRSYTQLLANPGGV